MRHMKGMARNGQAGFTLIEISIGLVILGLVAVALLVPYQLYLKNKVRAHNEQTFEGVTMALAAYVQRVGNYPCPALPNLGPGDAGFGQQNCAIGAVAGDGGQVLIGAVPVNDLGLPHRAIQDPFGAKLTYAVTRELAIDPATYAGRNGRGAITVVNDAGAGMLAVPAPFVLVSHGPDVKGARMMGGAAGPACGAAARDSENCDGDSTFRDGTYSPQTNVNAAVHYDDMIAYTLLRKETTMWTIRENPDGNGGVNISNRNMANVGIGAAAPQAKLHVGGGNVQVTGAGPGAGTFDANGDIRAEQDVKARRQVRAGNFSGI